MTVQVSHHTATPTLSVTDPRGLAIRSVGYCRQRVEQAMDARITRQRFDAAGRLIASWDPRLWEMAPRPNLATTHTLSGTALLTDSVDGGWQLSLLGETGQSRSGWDGRGSQRHTEYDGLQRPVVITEQASDGPARIVDRLTYGSSDEAFAEHNQCGQVIRHDDPAGSQVFADYGLHGLALSEDRRVLSDLETPDWPLAIDARDALLEPQSFITTHTYNPTGEIRVQTDAKHNLRTFSHTVAGELKGVWLKQAAAEEPHVLVSNIHYNAFGQIDSETAGNGVVTTSEYGVDDGRLIRLVAGLAQQKPLQDLNYTYDPVGNIVELQDRSRSVGHFNNQRIEPVSHYRYDSLSQLVEAKGWEVSAPSHGPALPGLVPTPLDPNQLRTYTQTFDYDRAGNLITRHHSDAPGFSMFTASASNRSLGQRDDGGLPGEADIAQGFDANGNQLALQRGQAMRWDTRNQLSRVTLVQRDDGPDDDERYVYDRPGHRLRKVTLTQTGARTLQAEVRYLPGLEIHRDADGEEHHVISLEAGRSSVRVLHWPTSAPQGIDNNQRRYSLSDHLGSSTLELDDQAGVLTQEHYYAFGGTACWAGKSALVAKYKSIRYSGKERDATGLYYYGYRYYAPWLQRWVSADPLGVFDGLNIYRSFKNSPVVFFDSEGTVVLHFSKVWSGSDELTQSKVVVNYEIPEMRPGTHLAYYLERSRPGNSFSGIVSVIPFPTEDDPDGVADNDLGGVVDIYPLSVDSRIGMPEWQSPYEGSVHDGRAPIEHNSQVSGQLTSHEQMVKVFLRDESLAVGFTLNDVRNLPSLSVEGYRGVSAVVGMSRSLNQGKTLSVSNTFETVGGGRDDYSRASKLSMDPRNGVKAFPELSTEVKRGLLGMFSKLSDALGDNSLSFKEMFEAELLRPELQVRRKLSLVA
ncbi:RHS repeat-associated core domain-containing protein [Pseudomonas purpurea]|uniref:RHS repeat domain-containing protein n=1 Tax=Pseudomonas purpurea TaxID=3136737 RepID=UPI003263E5CA